MNSVMLLFAILFVSCSANISLSPASAVNDIEKANRLFTDRASTIVLKDSLEIGTTIKLIRLDSVHTNNGTFAVFNISKITVTRRENGFFYGVLAGATPGIALALLGGSGSETEGINPVPALSRALIIVGAAVGGVLGSQIYLQTVDSLSFR